MFCPNCGTRLVDGNTICSNCNCNAFPYIDAVDKWETYLQYHPMPDSIVVEETNNPEEHKVKMTILLPAIIIYTLFMGYLIFIYGGVFSDPLDTFKENLVSNGFVEESGERYVYIDSKNIQYIFDFDDYEYIQVQDDITYTYYYKNDVGNIYIVDGNSKLDASYDFDSEEYTCETVTISNSYCDSYKNSIIDDAVTLKKIFFDMIDSAGITVDELIKGGE